MAIWIPETAALFPVFLLHELRHLDNNVEVMVQTNGTSAVIPAHS